MRLLTKTYAVSGLNRALLFQKLTKKGVNLLKVKIIDKKCLEITIDNKDSAKFFAICKKTWYNKLINVGGVLAPLYYAVKLNLAVTVGIVLFFAVAFFGNNVYLGAEYRHEGLYYRFAVEKAFEEAGIKKYRYFSSADLERAISVIEKQSGIGFLKIEKCGNRAIIDLIALKNQPNNIEVLHEDLVAKEDLKIIKISVYSGTPIAIVGQTLKKGDIIAGAYNLIDEDKSPCPLVCSVSAECAFTYLYESPFPIDGDCYSAVTAAKFMLGDYPVLNYTVNYLNERTAEITIYYEKIICGG